MVAPRVLLIGISIGISSPLAFAQPTVNIAQVPMLALKSAPGLVMLTLSRDHRLFYAAYNDASDLDGDGVLDVGFKPEFNYYGYFVSDRCYTYNTSKVRFIPNSVAGALNTCSNAWSGNWLNWATMSRMDALRRVLYGGQRVVDPTTATGNVVLQGAFIPQDSHVWGKEFRPVKGRDSYDISRYTPFAAPAAGKQHLFAVRSPVSASADSYAFPMPAPQLLVILGADQVTERIWNWASTDIGVNAIAANTANFGAYGGRNGVASTAYSVSLEACVVLGGLREANCAGYPSNNPKIWKPVGVLHDYAANDALKFGLITGSYKNNYSGGVVRRNIASFQDEIDPATGAWRQVQEGTTQLDGIARTIDRIGIYGWNSTNASYNCGAWNAPQAQGGCPSWGAPVGEMMYEALRYFSGKSAPTSAYFSGVGASNSADTILGLPTLGSSGTPWKNPYRSPQDGGNLVCARPVQMVIADPVTGYDSDQLPGVAFPVDISGVAALGAGDMPNLNVASEVDKIWNDEGLGSRDIFIGSSGNLSDGNPTAKRATGFSKLRGHAPDATQTQGSFYSAGVARYGFNNGIVQQGSTGVLGTTTVQTLGVALGSVVPKIEFRYKGMSASLVPLSKSVGGYSGFGGINPTIGAYQATGAITGFYLDSSFNMGGPAGADYDPTVNGGRPQQTFEVNFSDTDEGTDNETDAIVSYTVSVNASNQLVVSMSPVNTTAAWIEMHFGYAITGTTKDGVYLEMANHPGGSQYGPSVKYYLDTLAGQSPAPSDGTRINSAVLPMTPISRTFAFNSLSTAAGYLPHDTLWYAAKYGGSGGADSNGNPNTYFQVTNPTELPVQIGKAFRSAAALAAVASAGLTGTGPNASSGGALFQAVYDSITWSSKIYALPIGSDGLVASTPIWEASQRVPTSRNIYLGRGSSPPLALTATGYSSLSSVEQADFGSAAIYQYWLGQTTGEERNGGKFRNRGSTTGGAAGSVLGDVVNSDPLVIGKRDEGYAESDSSYTSFINTSRGEMLAVGTNNGLFQIFDARAEPSGGAELFGFVPQAARVAISDLASPAYLHRYFVDGPSAVGHAKIATPNSGGVDWRNIVIGTGGGGVQTVFAIDASSNTFNANSVLWEINRTTLASTYASALGNVIGKPAIGKLQNGTWVAIFANGYNSADGLARLFVVNLATGAVIRVLDTNAATTANGLSTIKMVRKTSGAKDTIEAVYGADYKGNIWRFDLTGNPSGWTNGAWLFAAGTARPITAEFLVGDAPNSPNTAGGRMVYFGTGSFLSATDPKVTATQALYGIYDDTLYSSNTAAGVSASKLSAMTITATLNGDLRTTSEALSPAWYTTKTLKGWTLALTGANVTPGERVIAPPMRFTVSGGVDALLFTSFVASTDPCKAGVDTWITAVDALTGGYTKAFAAISQNSVHTVGGSPRGGFVTTNGKKPSYYLSFTLFNADTAIATGAGKVSGVMQSSINGIGGVTGMTSLDLNAETAPLPTGLWRRQVWRQLK